MIFVIKFNNTQLIIIIAILAKDMIIQSE